MKYRQGTRLAACCLAALLCVATVSAAGRFPLRDGLVRRTAVTAADDTDGNGTINAFDFVAQKRAVLQPLTNRIPVSDTEALLAALRNAQPGDEIIVAAGTYTATVGQTKGALFYGYADGTEAQPIRLRSADPENPAVLSGTSASQQYVLYLTGDYWQVEDICLTGAQKGLVLDHANHAVIDGCEVCLTGSEGIALRDGSSDCVVQNTRVHDTGTVTPGYGEGIYIGSWYGETAYAHACDNNRVSGCVLGPNIAAEHVDIKEMTTGNVVENCTMYGAGMSGENYADSFIDIAGNEAVVCGNTFDATGSAVITDAVQLHPQTDGWGVNNRFYGNTALLPSETMYLLSCDAPCTVFVRDNTRVPAGNLYRGNYTDVDAPSG